MAEGYVTDKDPFVDLLMPAPWDCPHGNGDNCECQLPVYSGLFIAPIDFRHDGKRRHVAVRMQQAHDGGMVQFIDPVTNQVVGSCGIHFMWEHVKALPKWAWSCGGWKVQVPTK